MINSLISVPTGYETESALVIAPYFDPWFGRQLAERLRPRRVRFVVDDGARSEDIERLEDEVRSAGITDLRISVAQANGLMHMKAYYFRFRDRDGNTVQRHLQFGSANATKAGYSGSGNAELIASSRLSSSEHRDIIDYFDTVLEAADGKEGLIQPITCSAGPGTPALFLPSFRLSSAGSPAGFDAWLQRGRLVAKHRDAQKFLSVVIRLKKSLPADEVAQVFAAHGMVAVGERNEVRHKYVTTAIDPEEKTSNPQWKSKFCVWTHLGEWISEECYKHRKIELVAAAKAKREAAINELISNHHDRNWKDERRCQFIQRLQGIWSELERIGTPGDYLDGDAELDVASYCDKFDKKLAEDARLALEPKFRERYVNGYDFPPVPKFRPDTEAWKAFVESWIDSIALEADKPQTRSLVLKTVQWVVRGTEVMRDWSSSAVENTLRDTWRSDLKAGSVVLAKYEDGDFYPATILEANPSQGYLVSWLEDGAEARVSQGDLCFFSDAIGGYFYDDAQFWEELNARASKYATSAPIG